MSYVLADSTGPLCDFASIGGYADFQSWARTQAAPVRRFVHFGFTEDLQGLRKALVAVRAPERVEEQRQLLVEYAEKAQNLLILSDGISQEQEEHVTAAASKENELHRAADSFHKKMLVAVKYAFAKGREAVDTSSLRTATSVEQASRAAAKAPQAVYDALSDTLPHLLEKVYVAGMQVGVAGLKGLRTAASDDEMLETSFGGPNKQAAAWARKHSAKLLDDLTATTQQDIAEAIARGAETGDLAEAYESILLAVGDADRAQLITQNESMTAASEGQRGAWSDAVEKGLLSVEDKRVWIVTEGCCDLCENLDGQKADINGEYPDEGGDGPPLHIRCRCTEGLAVGGL